MACSLDVQPEFVPNILCSDQDCDQLANFLVNEAALDELWRAQGFPTPPTTPERVYTPSNDMEEDSENEELPMLNELILLAYGEEALSHIPITVPPITTATNLQDNLIQDCMWSSHLCTSFKKLPPPAPLELTPTNPTGDPQGGNFIPDPSPPSPPNSSGSDSSPDEEVESDCVSPSAVFPSLLTPPTNNKSFAVGVGSNVNPQSSDTVSATPIMNPASSIPGAALHSSKMSDPDWEQDDSSEETTGGRHGYERTQRHKRKLSTAAMGTGANSRHQPQSELSTSDEEIDVVTVPTSERTRLTRKRCHPLSAPCSRQASPLSPPKRKKYHTKRLQRLSSAGSSLGDGLESDDEARRASHNVLERKRRNDLKSSFQRLREEIPELEDNQRAPKVTILRKAMDYIHHMQEIEQAEEAELVAEKRRKARLLDRLNKLRSGRL